MRILIIEDEVDIAEPIAIGLRKKGYAVDFVENGKEGYEMAYANAYDCIILDLNLPDMDGIDVAKKLRSEDVFTPILMLTARSGQESVLTGFESGSDDYMTKPFNFTELVYRINSLVKRNSENKDDMLEIADIKVDLKACKVFKNNVQVDLNNKEMGLLEYLIRNKGRVVSQEELLEHVWDREIDMMTQTVRTNIKTLRKKIDADKSIIKNIKGKGYIIDV